MVLGVVCQLDRTFGSGGDAALRPLGREAPAPDADPDDGNRFVAPVLENETSAYGCILLAECPQIGRCAFEVQRPDRGERRSEQRIDGCLGAVGKSLCKTRRGHRDRRAKGYDKPYFSNPLHRPFNFYIQPLSPAFFRTVTIIVCSCPAEGLTVIFVEPAATPPTVSIVPETDASAICASATETV